ncbi:MAG: LicD family protein [Chlamydiales bacterium]|nr:LicD family protein [Chlamydiales bacterium]
MFEKLWDVFVDGCHALFVPLIYVYYAIASSLFLNSAASDATGLERAGDIFLTPFQYVFCGQLATPESEGKWIYTQRFSYENYFWVKTGTAVIILPISTALGAAIKGLAYLCPAHRKQMEERKASYLSTEIFSNLETYKGWGMKFTSPQLFTSQGHQRRPGDEHHLAIEKEALKAIGSLLTKAQIPWWIDCGTCLGAYRYGGAIPWDEDIDIAVLEPDFDNVRRTLLQLDPEKYLLQDWSGRLNPHNYFKVYIKQTGTLVDIYHFAIEPTTKMLRYILSLETSSIFPQWWKIRERRFIVPVSFDTVFPLKKTLFDGIEVYIPNDPVKYLQRYYGENLDPAKVYDPTTGHYEKALNHPYWQRQYAH